MPRTTLTDIAPHAWEHPSDQVALRTLRALPGFDAAVGAFAKAFGERGVRHLFLASAVRVGPTQRPQLDALWTEVLQTLDWPTRPQLFVTASPTVHTGAVGFGEPFVVINASALEHLTPEELRVILAHELGHVMRGHVAYRTIAQIILMVGMGSLPFLAGVAILPFQLAILEWYRKTELSADRAALLGTQDADLVLTSFLKLAGGPARGDALSLDAFKVQAREYELDDSTWDTVLKAVNTAFRMHPFYTVRAGELQRWMATGAYDRILAGEYLRRADARSTEPAVSDVMASAARYTEQARATVEQVGSTVRRAADAFVDAMKGGAR